MTQTSTARPWIARPPNVAAITGVPLSQVTLAAEHLDAANLSLEEWRAGHPAAPERTDVDAVVVLPAHLRPLAHPLTWAYSEDDETVGLECEYEEDTFEVDYFDARDTTDGDPCPSCGRQATRRVILGWGPRTHARPLIRP
jgi:hypothetical protein